MQAGYDLGVGVVIASQFGYFLEQLLNLSEGRTYPVPAAVELEDYAFILCG